MNVHPSATPSGRLLSPAVSSAIAGAIVVGLTAAVIAFVFVGPLRQYAFSLTEILIITLLGSLFGVVAGGVAGASETGSPEQEPPRQAIKARAPRAASSLVSPRSA